ncbi:hypothetical protein ES707_07714 [subsurface metagenome]
MSFGSKIRNARKRLMLKQKELAGLVGITPGALSLIEEDKRSPSKEVLKKIAKSLSCPPSFLLQPEEQLQPYELAITQNIEMIFKKIPVLNQDKELITKHLLEFEDPEDYARELRKMIGDEEQIIDPFQVAEDLGIKVREDNFQGFDGALIRSGKKTLILLSVTMSRNRKIFTLAHELGHWYMLEHNKGKEYICGTEDVGKYSPTNITEHEADRFATEFLMPRKIFQKVMKNKLLSLASIKDIADYFNISMQAAALRYAQLAKFPCAVIVTDRGIIKWFFKSASFRYFINIKVPPSDKTLDNQLCISSIDRKILRGRVPISAWVKTIEIGGKFFFEESIYFLQYDTVLTLLVEEK